MSQHALGDKTVHPGIGLVKPQAPQPLRIEPEILRLGHDHLGNHWNDFLEHLAPFLNEELVRLALAVGRGTIEKAEIVANVVRKDGLQLRAENIPVRGRCDPSIFDEHRSCHIAKNEMTVTIAPVEVAAGYFRAYHQHASRVARADVVRSRLDAERRR